MNTVHGGTVFMLPQSTQRPQRCSIGFLIGTLSISSLLPLLLWLDLKLSDLLSQTLNTPLVLLRNLIDFLHGIVNLHGA